MKIGLPGCEIGNGMKPKVNACVERKGPNFDDFEVLMVPMIDSFFKLLFDIKLFTLGLK